MLLDLFAYPQLLAQPQRHRHQERTQAARRIINVSLKQSLKLQERLIVEGDVSHVFAFNAARLQAILDGIGGKAMIMLLARETLLLRRRHDLAVAHQTRRRVVVIGRDAENVCGTHQRLNVKLYDKQWTTDIDSER